MNNKQIINSAHNAEMREYDGLSFAWCSKYNPDKFAWGHYRRLGFTLAKIRLI